MKGFIVGGIMVGRSLWEYSVEYVGLFWTAIIGFLVFTFSGLTLYEFRDKRSDDRDDLLV